MNDELEESGQRRRIPRVKTDDQHSESNDSTEQQPLSSDSPALHSRSHQPDSAQQPRREASQQGSGDDYSSSSSDRRAYTPRNPQYRGGYHDRPNNSDYHSDKGYRDSSQRPHPNSYREQGNSSSYQPRRDYPNRQEGGYNRAPRQDDRPYDNRRFDNRRSDNRRYDDRRPDDRRYPDRRHEGPPRDDRRFNDRPYDDRRSYDRRGGESGYNRSGGYQDRSGRGERPDRDDRGNRSYSSGRPYENRGRYNDRGSWSRSSRDGGREHQGRYQNQGSRDMRGRRSTQQRPTNITKALVRLLYASRGFSLEAIRDGQVRLNGNVVSNPNTAVRLLQDEVSVNGVFMAHNPTGVYVVMNKPKKFAGCREPESRHILNLISKKSGWYIPGGPLAKSVSGIIILTNDPVQADPQNNVFSLMDKEYWIKVNSVVTKRELTKIIPKIVELDPENKDSVSVDVAQKNTRHTWISITVRQAKIHDLTKILAASGMEILAMERRRIGSLSVDNLPAGSWRRMSEQEVESVITSSVSKETMEEMAVQDPVLPSDTTNVWQRLYQRWFKST